MQLQVNISLNANAGARTELRDLPTPTASNVSNFSEITNTVAPKAFKGFQLSTDEAVLGRLDSGYKFFPDTGYSGYMSSVLSDAGGKLDVPLIPFYVVGNGALMLSILFDPADEGHAVDFDVVDEAHRTVATVRNNTRKEVNVNLQVVTSSYFALKILRWSRPYASATVARILVAQSLVFTGKDLVSCEWSESSLDTQMSITPGIVSQYADVVIYDREQKLRDYIASSAFEEAGQHKITLITSGEDKELHEQYTVSVWDASGDSAKVKLTCADMVAAFDKIELKSYDVADRTVNDMLEYAFARAGNVPWRYLDSTVELECKAVLTPDNWFYPCTLLKFFEKVCVVGMLRVFWSRDSFIVARCW